MRQPEGSMHCGKLRKLRGEIGPGVKLRVRKVAPDQPQGLVALQERLDRPAGNEAEWAAEVAVLDQRQFGHLGAENVIARLDWSQGAGAGHV